MRLTNKTTDFILQVGKYNSMERKISASRLSLKINTTRGNTIDIAKRLEENNFIYRSKQGRDKYIYLTKDGWKAFHALRIMKELNVQ